VSKQMIGCVDEWVMLRHLWRK